MDKIWRKWGPYLSERQWGTVREDYSDNGDAWGYFPFEMAASRAYRWGEDGIAGISDDKQRLCFSFAFWNGKDPILKERFFGLSNAQGNHGEDVKEYYYYLDNTPTHSYMKMLYKYPQALFPYEQLKNHQRTVNDPELELIDTGVFDENRYFDICIEYGKADPEDLLIRCTIHNRGPEKANLHVLPTLWLRNTWIWSKQEPLGHIEGKKGCFQVEHPELGTRYLYFEGAPTPLFTDNETNAEKLFQVENVSNYVKDAFHEAVVQKNIGAINPKHKGTKSALHYIAEDSQQIWLRLTKVALQKPFADFEKIFEKRIREADEFYDSVSVRDPVRKEIQRQAWAGLLWSKQFYHYIVEEWLSGDEPAPDLNSRIRIRNARWRHFYSEDVLSMPDKWEYPWFAAWDMAFHSISMVHIDPEFAKSQLLILVHDLFMHPSGQIPAYEWDFENVNPPVLAWAAWQVYSIEKEKTGEGDRAFLERMFQKFLISFTWWINRKDYEEKNVFEGGFLGMDNISLFDRNAPLPPGVHLIQSDATSWMGMFCLHMSTIALELAQLAPYCEEMAVKFFSHFLFIGEAIDSLWDNEEGFYFDLLQADDGRKASLKIHSLVGLIPLLAVGILGPEKLESLKEYTWHFRWLMEHRPQLFDKIANLRTPGQKGRRLFSILTKERLEKILQKMLDESEFLSPHGIRSLSRFHKEHPFSLDLIRKDFKVDYEPAESSSHLFGGNSNWRGPVWFPLNYLLIEALEKLDEYYGDHFKIECPTGSGHLVTLSEIAQELRRRLIAIFEPDAKGFRPVFGDVEKFQKDPLFKNYLLFYEYFHGDTGKGLGASHQTGWTSLIAPIIGQA
jgi:hypothetical protein